MALAIQRRPNLRALNDERRRHQRVKVNLLGRYMLADRREFPCQVVNMSPGGMALIAPVDRRQPANASSLMSIIWGGSKARSPGCFRTASR